MKIVIVEDEVIAAQALSRLIQEIKPEYSIQTVLQTVEDSVEWFSTNPMPDLVFMDIHLADGSSFEMFDDIQITCPIIFTTAYNEYALEAFEVNGIDYLLKPINKKRLVQAIEKFSNLSQPNNSARLITDLMSTLNEKQSRHKTHFLIPYKDKLLPLAVADIAYCYSELKIARVVCFEGQTYSLDYSLEELMKHLNPDEFFRVNRQYIVPHKAIRDLTVWFGGKLSVNLTVSTPERIIVSKARASEFKAWFTRDF